MNFPLFLENQQQTALLEIKHYCFRPNIEFSRFVSQLQNHKISQKLVFIQKFFLIDIIIQQLEMKILKNKLLSLFLFLYTCKSQITQIPLYTITGTIPSNVFEVPLQIGDTLNATRLWSTGSDSIFLYLYKPGQNLITRGTYEQYKPHSLTYTATVKATYFLRVDCNKPVVGYKINIMINSVNTGIFYGTAYKQYDISLISFPLKIDPSYLSVGCYFKVHVNNTQYTKQFVCADCLQASKNQTFNLSAATTQITTQIKNQNINIPSSFFVNGPTTAYSFTGFQIKVSTFSDRPCVKPCMGTLGIYPGTYDTCICYDYQVWNSVNKVCAMNCSAIQYATTNNGTNACNCQSSFIWDGTSNKCVIDCSSKANTNGLVAGTIDQCTCNGVYSWNTTNKVCYINCASITFGSFINGNNDKCSCSSPYIWNSSRYDCSLNCSAITYAIQLVSNKIDQCTCQSTFNWNLGTKKCVIDCTAIANAVGPVSNKIDECTCDSTYEWSSGLVKCMSVVIDCSNYPHSAGPKPGSNSQCLCDSGFAWNQGCIIDCSQIANTNGLVSGTTDQCRCKDKFIWQAATYKCKVDCNAIAYTSGAVAGTDDQCICQSKFIWDTTNDICKIDCASLSNTTSLAPGTVDQCTCLNLYDSWDATAKQCTYNCLTISQSDSLTKNLYQLIARQTTCTSCTHNCMICSPTNPTSCYRCKRPYSKYAAANNGQCYRCGQDLCIRCNVNTPNVCQECQEGSSLNSKGKCQLCPARCSACSGKRCTACFGGSALDNGICKACNDQGCLQCIGTNLNKCLACADGFYLHPIALECMKCKKKCKKCNANGCLQAEPGTVVLSNTFSNSVDTLVSCKPGCKCTSNQPDTCTESQKVKFFNQNDISYSCQVGCQTCTSSTQCTKCIIGYELSQQDCLKCEGNCLTCNPLNLAKCLTCKRGFSLVIDSCQLTCQEGCLECDQNNVQVCYECNRGYTLIQETKTCMKCFGNCLGSCDAANVSVCLGCSNGFELLENKCVRCPENCLRCVNGLCLEAAPSLDLIQNTPGNKPKYITSDKCNFPCLACQGGVCTECQFGYTLDSSTSTCIIDTSCQPNCSYFPPGTLKNQNDNTIIECPSKCASCLQTGCVQCQQGYYLNPSQNCVPCPAKCKTCYNSQTCKECAPGYLKQLVKTNAYIGYDYQQYIVKNDECIQCSPNCQTCATDPDLCMSCDNDHVLADDRCAKKYFVTFAVEIQTNYSTFVESGLAQTFIQAIAVQAGVTANEIQLSYISSDPTVIGGKILVPETVIGDGQLQASQIQAQLQNVSESIGQFAVMQLKSSLRDSNYSQQQYILQSSNSQEITPKQEQPAKFQPDTKQTIFIAVGGGVGALIATAVIIKLIMAKMAGAAQLAKVGTESTLKIAETRVERILESTGEQSVSYQPKTNNRLMEPKSDKNSFKPRIDRENRVYMNSLKIHPTL